ncbi:protein kinase [Streptomyces sp. NPDC056773]|uniref:serine/threonine-protein kinase n=1 Tax=unclassified Streptomyces TaxID=2593676 RepID=UPI003692B5CF
MRGELLDGRYRLEERLGAGGMGEVWAAEDVRMRRPVAAKLVDVAPGRYAQQLERRFTHEVRSAANLPHRHTVTVHDCGEAVVAGRRTLYLVMERLDGRDLADVFHPRPGAGARTGARGGPPVPWYDVVDWAAQVGSALAAAHRVGILHRDIKPQNVMLTGDGVIKVLDFGLAKILRESLRVGALTDTGTALGTLPYMSPEQCRGETGIDHRTDLYSLGCLLYEGLTGRPPFTAAAPHVMLHQQLYEDPRPLTAENAPGVPPGVAALVARLLAKDRTRRPADADTVVAELRRELAAHRDTAQRDAAHREAGPPEVPAGIARMRERAEREVAQMRLAAEEDVRALRTQFERDVAGLRAAALRERTEARDKAAAELEEVRAATARATAEFEARLAERRRQAESAELTRQAEARVRLAEIAEQAERLARRAQRMTGDAERRANEILDSTWSQAEEILADARAKADLIRRRAEREAEGPAAPRPGQSPATP